MYDKVEMISSRQVQTGQYTLNSDRGLNCKCNTWHFPMSYSKCITSFVKIHRSGERICPGQAQLRLLTSTCVRYNTWNCLPSYSICIASSMTIHQMASACVNSLIQMDGWTDDHKTNTRNYIITVHIYRTLTLTSGLELEWWIVNSKHNTSSHPITMYHNNPPHGWLPGSCPETTLVV